MDKESEIPTTNAEPLPVVPLDYSAEHRKPWLPMVQMVLWLVMAFQVYQLLAYVIDVACYFARTTNPLFRTPPTTGLPLLTDVPNFFAHLIILLGAHDAMRMLDVGRRWIISGALIQLVVMLPMELIVAVHFHVINHHRLYGPTYSIVVFASYMIGGVGAMIFPYFMWKFFRRYEVRELFVNKS